jgi:predicted type IV restriction endonuclease
MPLPALVGRHAVGNPGTPWANGAGLAAADAAIQFGAMTPPADLGSRPTVDATVRALRARIAQARARSAGVNEENTKRVLITPLLEALGWDVLDLDEVQNEYRTKPQDNPVDYAMFLRRSPVLFFEAKALGQAVTDRRWVGQNVGYASVAGVDWCVLTNGDEYRLYNAHAPVDADEKLFRAVKLSDEAQHDHTVETLSLLSKAQMQDKQIDALWAAHFVDRRVKAALEALLAGDDALVRLVARTAGGGLTATDIRQALARADVRVTFPQAPRPPAPGSAPPPRPASPDNPRNNGRGGTGGTGGPKPRAATPRGGSGGNTGGATGSGGSQRGVTMADLIAAGIITAPLDLEVSFKGQPLRAQVSADGSVVYDGRSFASPSLAGAAAVERPTCNGWIFWRYRDPSDGQLKLIDTLRERYRAAPARPGRRP